MSNQVQIRRDTDADVMAGTPVEGEVWYNITKKRLHAGDGVTAGGIILPNAADLMGQSFTAATAGGSANALTLSLPVAPAAYAKYQRFTFEAASTNTGPATLSVNGLSAIGLRKVSSGALAALDAGDLISGLIYSVVYNGSYFVLEGGAAASSAMGELLSVVNASGAGTIDFTSGIDSSYAVYELVLDNLLPGANGSTLALTTRRAGTGSFDSSGYLGSRITGSNLATAPAGAASSTGSITLMANVRNDARGGVCGFLRLSNFSSSSVYKAVSGHLTGTLHPNTELEQCLPSGRIDTATALDGVRLAFPGTTISGGARLYGLRKTL